MLRVVCSISLYFEAYPTRCIPHLFSSHILDFTQVRYTQHFTITPGFDNRCLVMTYISVSATQVSTVTPELAFYFVAIVNGTSIFGRSLAGVLADVIGNAPPLTCVPCLQLFPKVLSMSWHQQHS